MGKRSPIEHREAAASLLRDMRHEAGLTQDQVAKRLGRPQSYVSKYEHAESRLDVLELRDVLGALDVGLETYARRLERRIRRIGPGTPPERLPPG